MHFENLTRGTNFSKVKRREDESKERDREKNHTPSTGEIERTDEIPFNRHHEVSRLFFGELSVGVSRETTKKRKLQKSW